MTLNHCVKQGLLRVNDSTTPNQNRSRNFATAGGVVGAVLASSCCVAPLVLITLGASGAWIGNLTALKAYQPVFAPITIVFLAIGFWQIYGKRNRECDDVSYCASSAANRVTKTALWIAAALVAIALSVDYWAPLFY